MRRHHHRLFGREAEHGNGGLIGVGHGLVGPRHLSAEHCVPRQAGTLCHIHQQRHIAVRQRRQRIVCAQPRQTGHRIGPGIESVPHLIEMDFFVLTKVFYPEFIYQTVEDVAMQLVEDDPALAAAPNFFHGRLVARPPGVSESHPVDIDALLRAERAAFADNARAPIDDSSKHIEAQGFHSFDGHCEFLAF